MVEVVTKEEMLDSIEQYVDLGITNPTAIVKGLEVEFNGLTRTEHEYIKEAFEALSIVAATEQPWLEYLQHILKAYGTKELDKERLTTLLQERLDYFPQDISEIIISGLGEVANVDQMIINLSDRMSAIEGEEAVQLSGQRPKQHTTSKVDRDLQATLHELKHGDKETVPLEEVKAQLKKRAANTDTLRYSSQGVRYVATGISKNKFIKAVRSSENSSYAWVNDRISKTRNDHDIATAQQHPGQVVVLKPKEGVDLRCYVSPEDMEVSEVIGSKKKSAKYDKMLTDVDGKIMIEDKAKEIANKLKSILRQSGKKKANNFKVGDIVNIDLDIVESISGLSGSAYLGALRNVTTDGKVKILATDTDGIPSIGRIDDPGKNLMYAMPISDIALYIVGSKKQSSLKDIFPNAKITPNVDEEGLTEIAVSTNDWVAKYSVDLETHANDEIEINGYVWQLSDDEKYMTTYTTEVLGNNEGEPLTKDNVKIGLHIIKFQEPELGLSEIVGNPDEGVWEIQNPSNFRRLFFEDEFTNWRIKEASFEVVSSFVGIAIESSLLNQLFRFSSRTSRNIFGDNKVIEASKIDNETFQYRNLIIRGTFQEDVFIPTDYDIIDHVARKEEAHNLAIANYASVIESSVDLIREIKSKLLKGVTITDTRLQRVFVEQVDNAGNLKNGSVSYVLQASHPAANRHTSLFITLNAADGMLTSEEVFKDTLGKVYPLNIETVQEMLQ